MWRPYKHVALAYRSVSIPRPYLSTAQAFYRKEISLLFTFSNSTLAVGCEEVRRAEARGPDRLWAESPVPGDLQSAAVNCAPTPTTSAPFSRTRGGGFPQTECHPATTANEPRHFRPRPAKLQVPAGPARGPPTPTSARKESQNSPRDFRASK